MGRSRRLAKDRIRMVVKSRMLVKLLSGTGSKDNLLWFCSKLKRLKAEGLQVDMVDPKKVL